MWWTDIYNVETEWMKLIEDGYGQFDVIFGVTSAKKNHLSGDIQPNFNHGEHQVGELRGSYGIFSSFLFSVYYYVLKYDFV